MGIGLFFALGHANATINVFTTQTGLNSFDSAVAALGQTLTTVDWLAATYPAGTDVFVGNPYSPTGGLTLTNNNWGFSIMNIWGYTDAGGNAVLDSGHGTEILATFASPVTAVSETVSDRYGDNSGLYNPNGYTFSATFTLTDSTPLTTQFVIGDVPALPGTTFFGFVSDDPAVKISSLLFYDDQGNAELDAIQYTPEPGFYGALALGMSGLLVAIRRRRVRS